MLVQTLGRLSLEGSGLTRPQPLLLLAYVALTGPTSRRELADLFFIGTADPRDSLSTALRYLRKEAPGSLDLLDGTVASAVPCDVTELLALLGAKRFEDAWGAYHGPFLAGLDLSLDEELEEWVFATRERIARRVRVGLLDLATERLNRGSVDDARRWAEEALRTAGAPEPEGDDLDRLVSLLQRVGSPELESVRDLADEAGVFDMPPLGARSSDARSLDAASFNSRSHNAPSFHAAGQLPEPRTSFIGRELEIDRLIDLLVREDARLVTVLGFGGIGKTRLALEVARRLRASQADPFPGGILYFPVEHAASARDVRGRLGLALGTPPPMAFDLDVLADAVGGRRMLVVLDNFEHLDPLDVGLPGLLDRCGGLHVMVTSRERLDLTGEYLFHLDGMTTGSTHGSVAVSADAPSLFLERAHRVRPGREFSEDDLRVVAAICKRLGGYPLGIELAASLARLLQPTDIASELDRSLAVLEDRHADATARHRNLRAAFEPSWERLTADEQRVMRGLSVFPAHFDHRAAREVAAATLGDLMRLMDRSMLGGDGRRFYIHPVMIEFVRDVERVLPLDVEEAQLRLVDWAKRIVATAAEDVAEDPHATLEGLDANVATIVAAYRAAERHRRAVDATTIMHLLVVGCNFVSARGGDETLLRALEDSIPLAESAGLTFEAHALATKLGNARRELYGALPEARSAYRRALQLLDDHDAPGQYAILQSLLAAIHEDLGDGDALDLLREAEQIAESARDRSALSHVLQNWGYVAHKRGDLDQMFDVCRRALDVALALKGASQPVTLEIDQMVFYSLFNLGEAYHMKGDVEESLRYRLESLQLARERDQSLWAAYALEEVGAIRHQRGERDLAQAALDEALSLYRSAGAPFQVGDLSSFMQSHGYAAPVRDTSTGTSGGRAARDADVLEHIGGER